MRGDDHHEAAFAVDVVKDLAPPASGTRCETGPGDVGPVC